GVLQGRAHYYERGRADEMKPVIRAMAELGCETLLQTNAAGSLRPDMPPGALMAITDHINFTGVNPLFGETGNGRFVDMADAYDPALRAALGAAGGLGADALGMSPGQKTIIPRHAGMKGAGLSLMTNYAAGMTSEPLGHVQ